MPNSPSSSSWFDLFNQIGIINQLASTRFERVLPDGLTLSQFSVLNNFARLGGTRTPAQLAFAFQVTKGAMTNTIKKLAAKGCVRITADPHDGRSKLIEITQQGLAVRERAVQAANAELASLSKQMPADTLALLPALRDLARALDAARDTA